MRKQYAGREVCHVWAQQRQDEGHNSGKTVFFEKASIFSYGNHFEMARFMKHSIVFVTTRRYSATTAKHLSWVRDAISNRRSYEVPSFTSHKENIAYLIGEAVSAANTAKRSISHGISNLERADNARARVFDYLRDFPTPIPATHRQRFTDIESNRLLTDEARTKILEKAEHANEVRDQRLVLKQEKQAKLEIEHLAEWRAGKSGYWFHAVTALRITGDEVETTRGARVPLYQARRLYQAYLAVKGTPDLARILTGKRVGHYTVSGITETCLMVGCHCIPWSEIDAIGPALLAARVEAPAEPEEPKPVICEDCLGVDGHEINCHAQTLNRG